MSNRFVTVGFRWTLFENAMVRSTIGKPTRPPAIWSVNHKSKTVATLEGSLVSRSWREVIGARLKKGEIPEDMRKFERERDN